MIQQNKVFQLWYYKLEAILDTFTYNILVGPLMKTTFYFLKEPDDLFPLTMVPKLAEVKSSRKTRETR